MLAWTRSFSIGLASGNLLIDAILQRDYPLSQALVAVLLAGVILINLVIDVLYGLVDPRISHA